MALKYRVNRYNWLAQKLLVQHQFSSIIWLKQSSALAPIGDLGEQEPGSTKRPVSEHLNYVHSLALLKTGTRVEAIIDSIQQLNFYQNSQYFLLLCQCLAYLGRHDSVVALCRQVIGQELDRHQVSSEGRLVQELLVNEAHLKAILDGQEEDRKRVDIPLVQQRSFDNSKIFAQITSSSLIANPRLWLLFGISLEYQHQLKDAQTAFKVASMLATCQVGKENKIQQQSETPALNNYFLPAIKYSEICARYKSHIKQAMQVLFPSEQVYPHNITPNHVLAFYLYKQVGSSKSDIQRAVELVTNLESYLISTKNPAQAYNQISLSCRQKFHNQSSPRFEDWQTSIANHRNDITELDFVLAKSFVFINSLVQVSAKLDLNETEYDKLMTKTIDQCIDSMLTSNSVCWNTPTLWNNLGICYLIKRRNIGSISCLSKAYSLNPLDWRINFNLAMACIQVGLSCKASVHLMAAKNLYKEQPGLKTSESCIESLITTLQAISYEKLNQPLEARRLYIEATQLPFHNVSDAPVLPTINYLILLHNHSDINNQEDLGNLKVQLHLLDKLEQFWLQRDKNSHQFQASVLKAATSIGHHSNPQGKVYAWEKPDKAS